MGVGDVKALVLLSGGLDSALAVKVIQEQGIEVVGLSFISPFFDPQSARKMAEELDTSSPFKINNPLVFPLEFKFRSH